MIVQVLFVLLLVAAVATWIVRRYRAAAQWRRVRTGLGMNPEQAIVIRRFDEMDDHVDARPCPCGGRLEHVGEGTRRHQGRVLRVARLACAACEETVQIYFDTTEVLH